MPKEHKETSQVLPNLTRFDRDIRDMKGSLELQFRNVLLKDIPQNRRPPDIRNLKDLDVVAACYTIVNLDQAKIRLNTFGSTVQQALFNLDLTVYDAFSAVYPMMVQSKP